MYRVTEKNTKISSTTLIAFGVAASCTLSAKVQASCTPADQGGANNSSDDVENRNTTCKEYSGSCSLAVEKYLSFVEAGGDGNIEDVNKVFSYGNYCGARRKCQSSKVDFNKDPPTPCNAIDSFCQAHDNCNYECGCEVNFLESLAMAAQGDGGTDGLELCDAPYYDLSFPGIVGALPEAILIAAPFCSSLADVCAPEFDGSPIAQVFCGTIQTLIGGFLTN